MVFDLGFLYGVTAGVSMIVVLIILNRTTATRFKESLDKKLVRLLTFFVFFCMVDMIWGFYFSRSLLIEFYGYNIFTNGFHLMSALSAFFWSGYLLYYMKVHGPQRTALDLFRFLALGAQIGLLIWNAFTHKAFWITRDTVEYFTTPYRQILFYCQMSHYILLMLYSTYRLITNKQKEDNYMCRSSFVFCIIPLTTGLAQMFYADAPMYSIGFMISAVAIYAFNVTTIHEAYIENNYRQQMLEADIKHIEQANQAKTSFMFSMSHDIRTPLNAILGFTGMAQKHINEPEKVSEYLNNVEISGQHLLSLINDVLDMSMIESGKMKLEGKPTDLNTLISSIVPMFETQAAKKEISLHLEKRSLPDPYVMVDDLRLNQVLINLVSNAIKYNRPGGSVTCSVEQISKTEDRNRGVYRFIVKDNGIGMTADFLEHIYESFARAQTTTESGIEGTGLGMPIVKKIIEAMDGSIHIDSTYGEGTAITIDVPLEKVEQVQVSPEGDGWADDEQSVAGKRVLLVDDNALNLEITHEILDDMGLIVDQATNGQEAFDMIRNNPVDTWDIVLMDVQMPKMNGYEATKAIRNLADQGKARIPILAMTANAFESDRRNALEAGMNDHLVKPVEIDKLKHALIKYTE